MVQKYEEKTIQDGQLVKTVRSHFEGENEKLSANLAIEFMAEANQESGKEIFSQGDKEIVREAIEATTPAFDPERKTVIQPKLNERSSVVAKAVGLAALGTAGMVGPDAIVFGGNALFREENLDIARISKNPDKVPPHLCQYYRQRMINWSNFEIDFVKGLKALLPEKLVGLPVSSHQQLLLLFDKFDSSIEMVERKAQEREQMSFGELLVDMGY